MRCSDLLAAICVEALECSAPHGCTLHDDNPQRFNIQIGPTTKRLAFDCYAENHDNITASLPRSLTLCSDATTAKQKGRKRVYADSYIQSQNLRK